MGKNKINHLFKLLCTFKFISLQQYEKELQDSKSIDHLVSSNERL